MVGRVFAAAVVTFWLASMAALVRFEYFPAPPALEPISTELVLRKIFSNTEPARMTASYQGHYIGRFTMDVTPELLPMHAVGNTGRRYHVVTRLHVRLMVFGVATKMGLEGTSTFDSHYELTGFALNSHIGDGQANITGDRATDKVKVDMQIGDVHETQEFPFSQVGDGGLGAALGVPGVADISTFGAFGGAASDTKPASTRRVEPVAHYDTLHVGEGVLRTYLIEYKLGDGMWGKVWVSEDGVLLQAETSFGLKLQDTQLAAASDAGVKPRS